MRIRTLITLCSLLFLPSTWADANSRCTEQARSWFSPASISCSYRSLSLPSGPHTSREIHYELPLGTPPPGGWPVALLYQGSIFPVAFTRDGNAPFGGLYEAKTIKTLLDAGYAVLAPRAPLELAWLTNSAGPATVYNITTDYTFLSNVFAHIASGGFGPLNPNRKYATGISSGGYNTSRMAVSFPGEFRALVVHSGSYATCLGPACVVPLSLPTDHPPTYFIHGFADLIVPWWSMDNYYDRLLWHGIETGRHTDLTAGHEWLPQSAQLVLNWFNAHP
ncbi:plasmid partitioning protein [Parahaliea mediterranea]|uniref:extracellular medium-chain-length polyhydroxyalkanoate depolymerase n=1 Tax=Parahaliea mediterranea TaxID=651086 RepID=UPI000E2F309B|nr:plasmid partitioning protein [Parahaliea mediterranea]